MQQMTLLELIVKLETLAAPDRALDVEIGRLQGVLVKNQDQDTGKIYDYTYHHYTESIDSALTLAPKGFTWLLREHDPKESRQPDGKGKRAFANIIGRRDDEPMFGAYHQTPALALCVAALKARAAVDLSSRKPDSGT